MPFTEKMDAAGKQQRSCETMFEHYAACVPLTLHVLTVCQCLNLLAETPEVRLSESILGRYPLLGLKLKRGMNGEDVRTGWFFFFSFFFNKVL